MERKLRVGIIGGGIGGLALAVALKRQGITVRVFERSQAFGAVGAGIQMTPNAVKVMRALGLLGPLQAVSFLPQSLVGRNWRSGRVMWRTPLAADCPRLYGAPFFHVHRADLHQILTGQLQSGETALSAACIAVTTKDRTATAEFADGSSYEADVIVGADGIHSTVRRCLFGDEPARYTGNMCWRAVVPFDTPPLDYVGPDSAFWLGPNGHVVTYYVSGGKAVNIVAVLESKEWVEESWNVRSTKQELMAGYQGWHRNVQKLFAQADEVYRWGLFDRDPMERWTSGRATLLGDAAHPMLPFLSQGAAMAIEDGYVLAGRLAAEADPDVALAQYEALRRPRTSRVQLESRERGRTYHLTSRVAQIKRDVSYMIRNIINPQSTGLKANWVYDYDAVAEAANPAPLRAAA